MNLEMILKIFLLLLLIFIIIYVFKLSKSLKLNNRISKYTVNNENKQISIGDHGLNLYLSIKRIITKIISKSTYFKNKSKKYDKFSHKINVSGMDIIATKFTISLIGGFIYAISSIFNSTFNIMFLLLIMTILYLTYNVYLNIMQNKRNKLIENDLLRSVVIMNNAFNSGYNITQAVDIVARDLTGPISEEFTRISNDLKFGLDIKDVFDRFYERVKLEDIRYITSSLALLNITGGNLVGVFNNIEKSFTDNKRLKDELNSMTSSSKLVYYVMLSMPIFLILVLTLLSPEYFKPLLSHFIGYLIIIVIISLYILYIVIIKKILKVDYE